MHDEAFAWISKHATDEPIDLLDLGGRNINGSAVDAFPNATATVLDIAPGPGVDIVADASTWIPERTWDVVVSAECFEHTPTWPAICRTAWDALKPGGLFIATMAGPGRPEHSGVDGAMRLLAGEYYGNVQPGDLYEVLVELGFTDITVDQQFGPCDTRAVARKP